jgi:hypothetical protein
MCRENNCVSWDIRQCRPLEINLGSKQSFICFTYLMLISCLPYSSALKMEAAYFSEMSVDFQRTTRRYTPEDKNFKNHRYEIQERLTVYRVSYILHIYTLLRPSLWKHSNEEDNSSFILIRVFVLCPRLPAYRQFRSGGRDSLYNEIWIYALTPEVAFKKRRRRLWLYGSSPNYVSFYASTNLNMSVPRTLEVMLECHSIYLSMALQPFVGPWSLFQFLDLLHRR